MITVLVIIILILLGIIFIQYNSHKKYIGSIRYIYEKLNNVIEADSSEKILLFTHDKEIRNLLTQINNLLEHKQKNLANYIRVEASMRKMLSNISHDLKTPLTVVIGYIETINGDNNMNDIERSMLLLKVKSKAQEVLGLINKFFDLAKLESGDNDIEIKKINLNEICRKNILGFYDVLTSKGLEVSIEIPDSTIYCLGNEEALDRILNNLISNSIKYGSEGKVLGLKVYSDEQKGVIEVWDKGKGISEVHKDRVFERMYTLEDSRNKSYESSGLGLTITKRLVERLGGEISLNSVPYAKTTFSVCLKKVNY